MIKLIRVSRCLTIHQTFIPAPSEQENLTSEPQLEKSHHEKSQHEKCQYEKSHHEKSHHEKSHLIETAHQRKSKKFIMNKSHHEKCQN